jgi:hypothetical protein
MMDVFDYGPLFPTFARDFNSKREWFLLLLCVKRWSMSSFSKASQRIGETAK